MANTIHVIESNDALAGQLVRALVRFGVTARRSSEGVEGVRRALADRPAAVVLGLMDAKGAGYAVCSKLRRKLRELPIIMVVDATEHASARLAEHRTLGTAADAYLMRPFSVRALHDTLASVLSTELPLTGDADELIGQSTEDGALDRLFEGEEDADIEAATEKWFDSIMSHDSSPPSDRMPPPRSPVENSISIEELEINLDELVPPAEDEVLAALRRENANLRVRVADLEAAREEAPSRASMGAPPNPTSRRELLELRQRLTERERELLEVRDKYLHAEGEAVDLEEAAEVLRNRLESIEKRAADFEGRLRKEATAREEAEAHLQRARLQSAEDRARLENSEQAQADAEEELVPLRAELNGLLKARDELARVLEETRQGAAQVAKTATDRIASLGAEVDEAHGALAAAKQAQAKAEATFHAEISAMKAAHADDQLTFELMQEEAAAQALSERDRRHTEAIAALETRHVETLSGLTDRAHVAEGSLAEKDAALAQLRKAIADAEAGAQRAVRTVEAQEKALGERASRLAELEQQVETLTASLTTAVQECATLTEDLAHRDKTLAVRERTLVDLRNARQSSEERLEQVLSRAAAREAALAKLRSTLDLAQAFLDHAAGTGESRVDPAPSAEA